MLKHIRYKSEYIVKLFICLIVLLTCNSCTTKSNNKQELYAVRLTTADKSTQIFITYKYPTEKIRDVALQKNQDLDVYGISFSLGNSVVVAKKGEETRSFKIPGSYFINILSDESLASGKTFSPFEGKRHPGR